MVARSSRSREALDGQRDAGFTLMEVLLVVLISGVLIAALATAISAAIRVTPGTEDRIDDARSTRALSTYLSHDTTSTPPFSPEQAQGGFDVDSVANPDNNDCGRPGINIVHMQWTESAPGTVTYVANYRFVVDGAVARVHRSVCSSEGGDPFELKSSISVTPALDPSQNPVATLSTDASGNVTVVSFTLTGKTGETVLVDTTSRNPSDYFS